MTQPQDLITPSGQSRRERALLKSKIAILEKEIREVAAVNEAQSKKLEELNSKVIVIHDLITAITGAIKVLEAVARIAKPIVVLAAALSSAYALWHKK